MSTTVSVIPRPNSMKLHGGSWDLSPHVGISFPESGRVAAQLIMDLMHIGESDAAEISLHNDTAITGDESYRLVIDERGVRIHARASAGFLYAAQTFRQLLPPGIESRRPFEPVTLPCLEIEDSPRFAHRGFMLDVSRHFFSVTLVKRVLDLLALHKINRLHWHLTDDQGFRIPVDKYPLLTEVGGTRAETRIGGGVIFGSKRMDGTPYSGFYSKDDIREVVAYARELSIEVIPEVDIPGHLVAALAAYPQYSCRGKVKGVRTTWGISQDVLCVGKPGSLEFIKNILAEVAELFPYKHIHLGGDECPTVRWKKCPDCQRFMKEKGYEKEESLQAYCMNEMRTFMESKGFQVITWDEALTEELDTAVIGQYWSPWGGLKRSVEAVKKGHKLIVSPAIHYYLDYSFEMIPLRGTYCFNPALDGLSPEEQERIMGVEAPLWTEFVDSEKRLHWQVFPQLTAVAESAWTQEEHKSFDDFMQRLDRFLARLKFQEVHHASKECYSYDGPAKKFSSIMRTEHPANREYRRFSGR